MKNHWLDKKVDKEIDAALAEIENSKSEFKDTDFIDLSNVPQHNDRYKEYDRLELSQKEFLEEVDKFVEESEEHDKAVVVEILLKYKNKSHWIDEVLSDVGYIPNYGCVTQDLLGNLTIGTAMPGGDSITGNLTIGAAMPGGDSITLDTADNFTIMFDCTTTITTTEGTDCEVSLDIKTSEFGQICPKCNEEMWPMNTAETMCQGDPACACYRNSCDLDAWYPKAESL